jgi:hypothetical protein
MFGMEQLEAKECLNIQRDPCFNYFLEDWFLEYVMMHRYKVKVKLVQPHIDWLLELSLLLLFQCV